MKDIWQRVEAALSEIDGALDELNPGVTEAEIRALEEKIGISLPEEFKHSYLIHDGQHGVSFLVGWRLWPLDEILTTALEAKGTTDIQAEDIDDSGAVKDCVANPLWVCFADNGGSGSLAIDLDPGLRGKRGQVIALYEDGAELEASGLREFLENTLGDIESGSLVWDKEAGGFAAPPTEQEPKWKEKGREVQQQIDGASSFEELYSSKEGDEITLVGAIQPNRKTNRHRFYAKTHSIHIEGPIARLGQGLSPAPPLVKVNLRVGKKRMFGLLMPRYEVISCERVG